ncbi:hypothetical protein phiLo_145 [Thermus phage phiLo]|nr:hypothetical protein phiLo_145 [Thermus phage phiLo]
MSSLCRPRLGVGSQSLSRGLCQRGRLGLVCSGLPPCLLLVETQRTWKEFPPGALGKPLWLDWWSCPYSIRRRPPIRGPVILFPVVLIEKRGCGGAIILPFSSGRYMDSPTL